jgi:hypothetical protein
MHREHVLTGRVHSEHIVQLFDDSESRAKGVAAFLAEDLTRHRPALVAVKASHWREIVQELAAADVNVTHATSTGQLTVLDAIETLSSFMRDDRPVHDLFRAAVGAHVARLAGTPEQPLRVYGELVEVLAEQGNFAAAAELESYWNEVAREHSIALLCGYSSAHFGPERSAPALQAICRAHTKVQTLPTDPLGAWLTDTVLRNSTPAA